MKSLRFLIIGLAFLAAIINYLDRTALSYAILPIEQTFHLTHTQFGLLASGFGLGYVFMTIAGGLLVDRFGAHKIWSIFAVLWSIACMGIGLATGFGLLFFFRVMLGAAEGPGFPAFTRVATDWLSIKERARALAFGLAAVPFASVIGAPLITYLMSAYGWRIMFMLLGVAGCIWAGIWFCIFRDMPKRRIFSKHPTRHPRILPLLKSLFFQPVLLITNFAFFAFGYLLFFVITWLPAYLEQKFMLPLSALGWLLMLPWFVATVFILLGGYISDWLWEKYHSIRMARSNVIWVCQALSVMCFIPVLHTQSLTMLMVWISLGIGFGLMPNAPLYAIHADLTPRHAATSIGVMTCCGASAGIIAPALTGWLSSVTGDFSIPIMILMCLTTVSSLAICLFQDAGEDAPNLEQPTTLVEHSQSPFTSH